MRVLVTGHKGYIGSRLVPLLMKEGIQVTGIDCDPSPIDSPHEPVPGFRSRTQDIRDLRRGDLLGFDAVVHLAALANDPVGDLDPRLTTETNLHASVALASLAREARVPRFLFSSSCSSYGSAGDDLVDEDLPPRPLTPYAIAKVEVEKSLSAMAESGFSPVSLRNATAYGDSPSMRLDLMINDMVGSAVATGVVRLMSDGMAWRPFVHVEDIARAFLATLKAPLERIHDKIFNVGHESGNMVVRQVARMVRQAIPGTRIETREGVGTDSRSYRVRFQRITEILPGFRPLWTVRQGIDQMHHSFRRSRMTLADYQDPRYRRLPRLLESLAGGIGR